ncbi:AAA family ATPase [Candidatus Phytoplasma prunorum]|uniref:AAA family ATPase n=1 Tax=Candidatus Phytoplasma prunorum TaxID=47565 RepID=UPI002FEF5368
MMLEKPLSKIKTTCLIIFFLLVILFFVFLILGIYSLWLNINKETTGGGNPPYSSLTTEVPTKAKNQPINPQSLPTEFNFPIEKIIKQLSNKPEITKTPPSEGDYSEENKYSDFLNPLNTQKFPYFKDLIGFKEEIEALDGFIHYLKNKESYQNIGKVEPPLGILLYGIPGTGKTTLSRAVAKETNLPFFEVSSALFSQKYIGVAPKMVRQLFENARQAAEKNNGAIIFLDECETIFTNLSFLEGGKETANIVNQFKTEITSMNNNPDKPIFIIGATNHYWQIDEAIKSRFTYHIEINPGTKKDRQQFLEFMIEKRKNPYNDEAKKYLLEDINEKLEQLDNSKQYLKTNRTLENLLKTTVSIFARNRKQGEELQLRPEINKEDLEKAYKIVIEKEDLKKTSKS